MALIPFHFLDSGLSLKGCDPFEFANAVLLPFDKRVFASDFRGTVGRCKCFLRSLYVGPAPGSSQGGLTKTLGCGPCRVCSHRPVECETFRLDVRGHCQPGTKACDLSVQHEGIKDSNETSEKSLICSGFGLVLGESWGSENDVPPRIPTA